MNLKAVLLMMTLILTGCDFFSRQETYDPVQEGVISLDDGAHSYKLYLPEDFEEEENFMNLYPLVIALHGRTSLTDHYYVVSEVKDAYPCVYFAPNNSDLSFGGDLDGANNSAWIREELHSIIENKNYKIDRNRIYIIGFSMGGMGTTYMAQDLYTEYGYLTAAIVPADGGYFQYIKSSEILDSITCWFHQLAYNQESDYQYAKEYYPGTLETITTGNITYSNNWDPDTEYSYDTTTWTLTQVKTEIFKLTDYDTTSHTAGPVFKNSEVIEWLFDQNLENRDIY